MQTGDKVLALLAAKLVCCALLVLGAAGLLGGLGAWLLEGPGRIVILVALVGGMAAIVAFHRNRIHRPEGPDRGPEGPRARSDAREDLTVRG